MKNKRSNVIVVPKEVFIGKPQEKPFKINPVRVSMTPQGMPFCTYIHDNPFFYMNEDIPIEDLEEFSLEVLLEDNDIMECLSTEDPYKNL